MNWGNRVKERVVSLMDDPYQNLVTKASQTTMAKMHKAYFRIDSHSPVCSLHVLTLQIF